jgi:hypothetical protein
MTSEEDAEAFFHAFERLQVELEDQWTVASAAKTKDATVLFHAMDKMLVENASTDWHDVLADTAKLPNKTWESFKKATAKFICHQDIE